MWGRLLRLSSLLLCLANTASAPRAPSSSTAEITRATVDVGRVFQSGGTDGLILYALVLSTFLMFIVAVATVIFAFRHIAQSQKVNAASFAAKDASNAEQTKLFIAAADSTADAINRFTAAFATNTQEGAQQAIILARIEGTDRRLETLLERLSDVPWERVRVGR